MKNFAFQSNLSEDYIVSNTPIGSEALIIQKIIDQIQRPVIYVVENREKQERFVEACEFLCPKLIVEALPAWDCFPYDRLFPSPSVIASRVKTLNLFLLKQTQYGYFYELIKVTQHLHKLDPKNNF